MSPEAIGELVNGAIPFLGGIYITLLGFRKVGKRPGEDLRYDEWHARFETTYKVLGPLLVVFGLFLAVRGLILFS